jgi:LysM repeat protein
MRKAILFFILFIITNTLFSQRKQGSGVQYVEKYKLLAISEMHKTGIPASITLAQALHESANGTSQLAVKANNHFGVKCNRTWNGGKFHRNGNRKNSCFRKYNTVEEAYADRSYFMSNNKQYAFLFKFKPTQYKKWAHGLQRSGYARSRVYASHLLKTIKTYELYQYDYARIDTIVVNDTTRYKIIFDFPVVEIKEEKSTPQKNHSTNIKHKVKDGQSLYYLSRKYHVSVEKIKKANGLKSNLIKPGKILVIPK